MIKKCEITGKQIGYFFHSLCKLFLGIPECISTFFMASPYITPSYIDHVKYFLFPISPERISQVI